MTGTIKRYMLYLILAALCIPLFYLNIYNVHVWGDDHSQYIKEAKNIAEGKPYYQSDYVFNHLNPEYGPPQYPPGFPLVLAPVIKIWGLSIQHMLYLIAAFLSALLFVLFHYFRRYTTNDITAICLAVICVYCSSILELKANVYSDIPCWLFSTIYLYFRTGNKFKPLQLILMTLAATMAILTRSQALIIVVVEMACLFLVIVKEVVTERKLNFKPALKHPSLKLIVSVAGLYIICSMLIFPAPASSLNYYKYLMTFHYGTWWEAISSNFMYLHDLIMRILHYYPYSTFWSVPANFCAYAIATFALLGFISAVKKHLGFEEIYYILIILLVIILSQHQGVRFIIYILPIHVLFMYRAMKNILVPLVNIRSTLLGVLLTLFYFGLGFDEFKNALKPAPAHLVPTDTERQAFDYIRQHVEYKDVILFIKPRLLSLYTEKRAIVGAFQVTTEENKALFDKVGVKYALLSDKIPDEFTKNYIDNIEQPIDTVEIAPGYYLFTLK